MCSDLLPLLDLYLDGEMSVAERVGVEVELSRCPRLAARFAREEVFCNGIRERLRAVEPPARLYERVAAMLAAARAE